MRPSTFVVAAAALAALMPGLALAHGADVPGKPGFGTLLTGWEFDFLAVLGLAAGSVLYGAGVKKVNRLHPGSPFPRRRVIYFAGGMAALVIALISPLAKYDTTLFSAHMWQHMLITMVAAPLIALSAPITLALRAASRDVRRGVLLPVLHSWPVAVLSFPVVAWVLFAATMWITHFSPMFDAALENAWWHRLEHLWYMAAGFVFWWPVVAVDPVRWRMSHPVRALYVFLQMPQNSFLAVAIYSSGSVIYSHYETLERTWGPSPLSDQQLAGISMWVFGDLLFLIALICVAYGWLKHEELEAKRQDRALARERALRASTTPSPNP